MGKNKIFLAFLLCAILFSSVGITPAFAGAPWSPELVSPANGATADSNPPTLCARNAGDPEGEPVYIRFETWGGGEGDQHSEWLDAGGTGNVVCWTNTGKWKAGSHSWTARAMDSNNDLSGASSEWSVNIPASSTPEPECEIEPLTTTPAAPQPVGTVVSIYAAATCTNGVSSIRFKVNGNVLDTLNGSSGTVNWNTTGYSESEYTVTVEAADSAAGYIKSRSQGYTLSSRVDPEPPKGPSLSQFNFNPAEGAKVGDSVNIHIKVDSSNPGGTKINVDCGGVSKIETAEIEFDSNWNTSGCPAQAVSVLVCSRDINDPNWKNATCTTRSYTLSPSQLEIPVPIAEFWSDSPQVSNGQCTTLRWRTENADKVDIDGNNVPNSGEQQVCPTVTKKYTLTATNQSGSANRNITIIVSDQPPSINVADYFQTGDVIQIGPDIYVIINGERRLVPNPKTLDALGISRSWVNNKGFGDADLKTIPLGQDVPDVNRDPSGFAAFKNKYFPNTTPIVPGTATVTPPPQNNPPQQPPSNGQWQVGARVGLCAGAQIRTGSGFSESTHTIVPENNWQVDIIGGPQKNDSVTWWNISRANIDGGGSGWIYFEQAGLCNNDGQLIPAPDEPQNPQQPNQPIPNNETETQPSTENPGGSSVNNQGTPLEEMIQTYEDLSNFCLFDSISPRQRAPLDPTDLLCGPVGIGLGVGQIIHSINTGNQEEAINGSLNICSGATGTGRALVPLIGLGLATGPSVIGPVIIAGVLVGGYVICDGLLAYRSNQ